MADKYIDLDETQLYGPHAVKQILAVAVGLVPELDPALRFVAQELAQTTQAAGAAIKAGRTASAGQRSGKKAKGPALAAAVSLLGRFSRHLQTHPESLDRKTFFPEDGTAGGVGRSAARVLLALGRIDGALDRPGCPVRDRETWKDEITAAIGALAPVVEQSAAAHTARRLATPEQEAAYRAFLQVYQVSKCVVEGVLRYAGKLHLLGAIFHDLVVPAGTKVTAIPTPPADPGPAI